MDLFNQDPTTNLLPYDGVVEYHDNIMDATRAKEYFEILLDTIPWKHDEIIIYGKHISTKRKVAWYGDKNYSYTYSHSTKEAFPWTKELIELKLLAEKISGETFNSCLLNLYHSGEEGMTWHSDDEKSLIENACIASLSFGATRKFSFKHKSTKIVVNQILETGSLLLMKDITQKKWQHALPKTKKSTVARINLTFRLMVEN
jgi:alkylated DNA repair dioxygenase AlkB